MEVVIRVPSGPERIGVLGASERNLKMIRETLGVKVTSRDDEVRVSGDEEAVVVARGVLERLAQPETALVGLTRDQVLDVITDEATRHRTGGHVPASVGGGPAHAVAPGSVSWEGELEVFAGARRVGARTENQEAYLEAIRWHDLVFGIGPAGTGKTYLAVAAAVHLLKTRVVRKLTLVRPAVEAGEKLGFLPGDLEAKVNPYLRPLLDALHDMLDFQTIRGFLDADVIEICPLAFMRGRTLNSSVIILDEAQNTTCAQMQMFLTRLGHGSKMIVTGDTTQIDLPASAHSGLLDALERLEGVSGVGVAPLEGQDVVRHRLVQRIIEAYAAPASPGDDEPADASRPDGEEPHP